MIWPFKKQPTEKIFKATAFGYYTMGIVCYEVYINLYEHYDGSRSYEEFIARECEVIPDKAAFSIKAEVEAWKCKGPLPRCLFNPFEDEQL